LNDAAADLPPAGRLSEYYRQGFDLVAFSGGKGLEGPQSTGLLLGRTDLIALGRRAISPQMGIGRGMKVGKEEIMGLLAAVERFVSMDHELQWRLWESRVAGMIELLEGIPRINLRREIPEIANHSPHLLIEWSRLHIAVSAAEVVRCLRDGEPPIAALAEGEHALRIAVWTLRDDEHRTVAKRIREVLSA
jgi:L-seryl-tRNA(Ser) seleniumtransferase